MGVVSVWLQPARLKATRFDNPESIRRRSDPKGAIVKNNPFSVLFVCTGNAGRSQMAQALYRSQAPEGCRVASAGVQPWPHLHPMAVKLLAERGLGVEGLYPKPVSAVWDQHFDVVVTIGEPARTLLPRARFPDAHLMHWPVDDPADADGTPDSEAVFRATAQAIEARLPEVHELAARMTGDRPDLPPDPPQSKSEGAPA